MKITMDKYLSEGKDIVFNSDEEANSFIDGVIADLKTIKKSKNSKHNIGLLKTIKETIVELLSYYKTN